jgi:hypothetical protein
MDKRYASLALVSFLSRKVKEHENILYSMVSTLRFSEGSKKTTTAEPVCTFHNLPALPRLALGFDSVPDPAFHAFSLYASTSARGCSPTPRRQPCRAGWAQVVVVGRAKRTERGVEKCKIEWALSRSRRPHGRRESLARQARGSSPSLRDSVAAVGARVPCGTIHVARQHSRRHAAMLKVH